MSEVGEYGDSKALRRRAFLKQAVLSGATLQLGGLLGSAFIAPADAQTTTVLITFPTTVLITNPTTILITNPTTILITNPTSILITNPTTIRITNPTSIAITFPTSIPITDSTTVPITFFQPTDGGPVQAVPGPSTLSLFLAAAGVSGAAALIKRLRAASSLQEPTPPDDDKVD